MSPVPYREAQTLESVRSALQAHRKRVGRRGLVSHEELAGLLAVEAIAHVV